MLEMGVALTWGRLRPSDQGVGKAVSASRCIWSDMGKYQASGKQFSMATISRNWLEWFSARSGKKAKAPRNSSARCHLLCDQAIKERPN